MKLRCLLIALFSVFAYSNVYAADPVLCFTDIINGPKTGLGDGSGSGAIVTVWGWNLGGSKGTSSITVDGVNAAHVYYWENADPSTGDSGPSNLHKRHNMQEVAFSIPATASDGAVKIRVTVGGVNSNELDFFIRSGSIYWVGDTPGGNAPSDATGDGSYGSPWATVSYPRGAEGKISSGDIIYLYDHITEGSLYVRSVSGSPNNHCALISYPGTTSGTVLGGSCAAVSYYCGFRTYLDPTYWVVSKLDITTVSSGIGVIGNSRMTGNRIWDGSATGNTPDVDCADGASGAITSGGEQENAKIYGNHVHDFGCQATTSWHHSFYFSVRNKGNNIDPMDIGWNLIEDSEARFGIHFYDENACYGYTDTTTVHHNWVENQVGPGFNVGAWACNRGLELAGDFDVYNNAFINNGLESPASSATSGIAIQGDEVTGHYRLWNNTIYNSGWTGATPQADNKGVVWVPGTGYPTTARHFAGTWDFVNNIVVDSFGTHFIADNGKAPTLHYKNVWYGPTGESAPGWDTSPIVNNPLIVNPVSDMSLQDGSPAVDQSTTPLSTSVPFASYGIDGIEISGEIGAYGNGGADVPIVPGPVTGLTIIGMNSDK